MAVILWGQDHYISGTDVLSSTASSSVSSSRIYPGISPTIRKPPFELSQFYAQGLITSTNCSGTSRIGFLAKQDMNNLQIIYGGTWSSSGSEFKSPNPIKITATLEWTNNRFKPVTFRGSPYGTVDPNSLLISDEISVNVTSNSQVSVRTFVENGVNGTLTSATASSLTDTNRNWRANQWMNCIVFATNAAATNQASYIVSNDGTTVNISPAWPVVTPSAADAYKIFQPSFRSIAVGGVSNTLIDSTLVADAQANIYTDGVCWIYAGTGSGQARRISLNSISGISNTFTVTPNWFTNPDNTSKYAVGAARCPIGITPLTAFASSGVGHNFSAVGSDQTYTIGTAWAAQNTYTYGPLAVIGTPPSGFSTPVVFLAGDSITFGQASINAIGYTAIAMITNGIPYFIGGVPSRADSTDQSNAGANDGGLYEPWRVRSQLMEASTHVIDQTGVNEFTQGSTLASIQATKIRAWYLYAARQCKVYQCTITPRENSSTNSYATVEGQIPIGVTVTNASNTTPIVIGSTGLTGLYDGQQVEVVGVLGNTAANGTSYAHVLTTTSFSLFSDPSLTSGVAGNGTYVSNGIACSWESNRILFNGWVRDGAPVVSAANLTATNTGTVGALRAGSTGHPLTGYFDTITNIECGVAAPTTPGVFSTPGTGGRWSCGPGNTNAIYTADGTHPLTAGVNQMWPTIDTSRLQ